MIYSNYLLFMASLANENAVEEYFKGVNHEDTFSGLQTNIAPSKYLSAVLASSGEHFSKIILLCTKEVRKKRIDNLGEMTTIEYYKRQITEYLEEKKIALPDDIFSVIPYDSEEADDVSEILKPILEILESAGGVDGPKRLYIDFTGGTRTAAMALVFIARFLATQGVEIASIIYANRIYGIGRDAENPAPIEECIKTYDTFDYFAGLVEQEAVGNSTRLLKYTEKYGEKELADLLKQANNTLVAMKSGQKAEKIENEPSQSENPMLTPAIKQVIVEVNSDIWAQIDKAVERRDGKLALNMLNEHFLELLELGGKLRYVGEIKRVGKFILNGSQELSTGWWYYNTYIKYVKKLLEKLYNSSSRPSEVTHGYTSETYKLLHYLAEGAGKESNKEIILTKKMSEDFKQKCSDEVDGIQKPLIDGIKAIVNDGVEISAQFVLDRVTEYNENLSKMQHLYFAKGFPFSFSTDVGNHVEIFSEYPALYKEALANTISEFDAIYGKDYFSYMKLIGSLYKNDEGIREWFPLKYSIARFKSDTWENPKDVAKFLQKFMVKHGEMRQYRNQIIHRVDLTFDEVERALEKVKQILAMLQPQ